MFRGDRQESQNFQELTSFSESLSSSTSLSSSFSSSASSSMLHHAVSSQSDIVTSDRSGASPHSTPSKKLLPSVTVSNPAPRSSSLGIMGETQSRPQQPAYASSPLSSALNTPPSASKAFKIKRAFGVRRKQSEDVHPIPVSLDKASDQGRDRQNNDGSVVLSPQASSSPNRRPLGAKQLTLQLASAFNPKQNSSAPNSPVTVSPISPGSQPPPPPPKPAGLKAGKKYVPLSEPAAPDNRGSIMASGPSIAAALHYMQHNGERSPDSEVSSKEKEKKDEAKAEAKESWRKSDSNMSFNTIRPGAGTIGNRNSRPVSMAESVQSTHTIVPTNKRLSALVTDADFVMAEEDDGERSEDIPPTASSMSTYMGGKSSPTGSVKARNRRSASVNLPATFPRGRASPGTGTADEFGRSSADSPRLSPSQATRETPSLTRAAANGYISPTSSNNAVQSAGSNIKGRLAAWSATTNNSPSRQDRTLPDAPDNLRQARVSPIGQAPPAIFRQTAVSITNGLGPAAGLAKRAVEKMGRAWGGMSSSSNSGYSSSSSNSIAPSSFGGHSVEDLGRNNMGRSSPQHLTPGSLQVGRGKQRRTPNGPSGSWSVSSSNTSSSISDSDIPDGPVLGKCMRGPTRFSGAEPMGGAVFGRDLKSCVAETALRISPSEGILGNGNRPQHNRSQSASKLQKEAEFIELETRRIPALIVRCAQHILTWGVQEEGLFRYVSNTPPFLQAAYIFCLQSHWPSVSCGKNPYRI